ncbi:hypothetical protein SZ64_01710 [Erythrobacter sp. SG61-1L]|uniref:DUF3617 family protein n=1 Tax=Erythrobacter sp. SG61-1L TaxID=1603897 RepID=UPI0006C900DC|nr:DUF3617 family protein [Erythrobacter sp. SG61-1L]KPL66923.1 hypothetical protein SZ64_01710 [Erythrobacter sp. SG61-1L]
MGICASCGNTILANDRFCGECGAPIADAADPVRLPALVSARRRRRRILITLGVMTGLIALGGGAFLLFAQQSRQGKVIRIALGDFVPDFSAEPEPSETPTPDASETPDATETPSPATSETPSAAPTAASDDRPALQTAIMPGNWTFTTVLTNVSKVDASDTSFQLNRQGLGRSETWSQCVSPEVAAQPRSTAFPFRPSMGCRPGSYAIAGGSYRASMTCNFPQNGGARPVEANGSYTADTAAITARVRVPAQVVSGDFAKVPEVYLDYRLTAARTGPCN